MLRTMRQSGTRDLNLSECATGEYAYLITHWTVLKNTHVDLDSLLPIYRYSQRSKFSLCRSNLFTSIPRILENRQLDTRSFNMHQILKSYLAIKGNHINVCQALCYPANHSCRSRENRNNMPFNHCRSCYHLINTILTFIFTPIALF